MGQLLCGVIAAAAVFFLGACTGDDDAAKDTTQEAVDTSTDETRVVDTAVAAVDEVRAFLGGRFAVLAYVDSGRRVQIVDYREEAPAARPLTNDLDCINPLISPDGTRVVYSQGSANGPKTIKVADIATGESEVIGRWDLGFWAQRGDEELIIHCDWSDKEQNGAGGKTYETTLLAGSIEALGDAVEIHGRAMDGGPNGSLTWLGQVYNNLLAYNLETKVEYPTEKFFLLDGSVADHQTCNGSMAPDDSARMMLLAIPHDYVRIFSYALSTDRFEETTQLNLPGNMAEWEYPEWTTHPDYFTAVLRGTDLKNQLYVGRIEEGSIVPDAIRLVDDDYASYSHLWVAP